MVTFGRKGNVDFFRYMGGVPSFALVCLLLGCTNDYNPFRDITNADAVITKTSFNDDDTLLLFSTETLSVKITVPELVESLSVVSVANRYFEQGKKTYAASRGNPLQYGPYQLLLSPFDTGAQSVVFNVFRTNGDLITKRLSFYVRSPLAPRSVDGSYGSPVLLATAGVADRDVMYEWNFKGGTIFRSTCPETTVVVYGSGQDGSGMLTVTDGYVASPPTPFSYTFTDTIGPIIHFTGDTYARSGDTIKTGDATLFFPVVIRDRATGGVDSATINGQPFSIIHDSVYVSIISRTDTLRAAKKLVLYAMDNFRYRNDTTITLFLIFDPVLRRQAGYHVTIIVPAEENVTYSGETKRVFGSVENISSDTFSVMLQLSMNGVMAKSLAVTGRGSAYWYWTAPLMAENNLMEVIAYDDNGDSVAYESRNMVFSASAVDTTPPVILETSVDGRGADCLLCDTNRVVLRIVAFDEASGIDTLMVNGTVYNEHEEFVWMIPLTLSHVLSGNKIEITACDKKGQIQKQQITLFNNKPPVIERIPVPKAPLLSGVTYTDTIIVRDPDGDVVRCALSKGDSSFTVSAAGGIRWLPSKEQIGTHEFLVTATDGYASVTQVILVKVVDSTDMPQPLLLQTDSDDFPTLVEAMKDTVVVTLSVATATGTPPVTYRVYNAKRNRWLVVEKEVLQWAPEMDDTGLVQLIVIAEDAFAQCDTLLAAVRVAPPNRPCIVVLLGDSGVVGNGVIDLSDSGCCDTLQGYIEDPDESAVETLTVEIIAGGIKSFIPVAVDRHFSFPLCAEVQDSGYDTLCIIASDRVAHTDSLRKILYYGTAPTIPFNPKPLNTTVADGTVTFTWVGGDVDGRVTYTLLCGLCPGPMSIITQGLTLPTCSTDQILRSGIYCWQVRASDGKVAVVSPVWSFDRLPQKQVLFATNETDFKRVYEVLIDTIAVQLSVVEKSGYPPYNYKATFSGSNADIPCIDGALQYVPTVDDTGVQVMLAVVTDVVGNGDTLRLELMVTPPNRSCSLSIAYDKNKRPDGSIDMSEEVRADSFVIRITDPDLSPPETFTFSITQLNSMSSGTMGGMRDIVITVDPWLAGSRLRDTIRAAVVDRGGHSATIMQEVYYGKAPEIPNAPLPPDSSVTNGLLQTITWQGGDLDGNAVWYDLYFGTTPQPNLLVTGWRDTTYSFADAILPGVYYWRVISHDARDTVEGNVWQLVVVGVGMQ